MTKCNWTVLFVAFIPMLCSTNADATTYLFRVSCSDNCLSPSGIRALLIQGASISVGRRGQNFLAVQWATIVMGAIAGCRGRGIVMKAA